MNSTHADSDEAVVVHFRHVKNAALFALIGMALLTVFQAVDFIRIMSGFLAGAIAAIQLLATLIRLLASLGIVVFFSVYYRAQ